jgi:hypothetical protein
MQFLNPSQRVNTLQMHKDRVRDMKIAEEHVERVDALEVYEGRVRDASLGAVPHV